jgi:hypothetical protein
MPALSGSSSDYLKTGIPGVPSGAAQNVFAFCPTLSIVIEPSDVRSPGVVVNSIGALIPIELNVPPPPPPPPMLTGRTAQAASLKHHVAQVKA